MSLSSESLHALIQQDSVDSMTVFVFASRSVLSFINRYQRTGATDENIIILFSSFNARFTNSLSI